MALVVLQLCFYSPKANEMNCTEKKERIFSPKIFPMNKSRQKQKASLKQKKPIFFICLENKQNRHIHAHVFHSHQEKLLSSIISSINGFESISCIAMRKYLMCVCVSEIVWNVLEVGFAFSIKVLLQ